MSKPCQSNVEIEVLNTLKLMTYFGIKIIVIFCIVNKIIFNK